MERDGQDCMEVYAEDIGMDYATPAGSEGHGLKIFVGGLPSDVTDEYLVKYFSQFGHVLKAKTKKWKSDKTKCKGFGILVVGNEETYKNILTGPHILFGRAVECKPAITNKMQLALHNQQTVAHKVFVTGIPLDKTDQELFAFFSTFAPVEMAYIVQNSNPNKKSRIGYVSFLNVKAKERVLTSKSYKWDQTRLFVSEYHTKNDLAKSNSKQVTSQSLQKSKQASVSTNTPPPHSYSPVLHPVQSYYSQPLPKLGLSSILKEARSSDGLYHHFCFRPSPGYFPQHFFPGRISAEAEDTAKERPVASPHLIRTAYCCS